MKKFFKILAGVATVLVLLLIGGGLFLVSQLPSANKISRALKGDSVKKTETESGAPVTAELQAQGKEQIAEATLKPADVHVVSAESKQQQAALLEDLQSPQKPMSSFCGTLKNSKAGPMTGEEFTTRFLNANSSGQADPRIEAMKPLFRFVFRLPKMQDLVAEVEKADLKGDDDNIFEKAQFYGKALAAYTEMRDHRSDMEAVMDRGYLFLGLNNLLAKKPNLIGHAGVQSYCSNLEKAFNDSVAVDFETEKKEFLNLVQEAGLQPQDIGFDLNYRSEMEFNFGNNRLTFKGGWLEDLIEADPPNQEHVTTN